MINRLTPAPRLTVTEQNALLPLRARYRASQHLFTDRELARLNFMRWLVQSPGWTRDMDHPRPLAEPRLLR
jgi:hypothetical protein